MDRYTYDLTHFSCIAGLIGRLNTIACVPIVAGDSFDLNMVSVARLAPMRQPLTIDPRYDIFGFYVKHRQVYGDDWKTFIQDGVDETTYFGSGVTIAAGSELHYHGCGSQLQTAAPDWVIHGYNDIWNRWFRIQNNDDVGDVASSYVPSAEEDRYYGLKVAMLPSYLTPNQETEITTADYQITLSGSVLDLRDIARLKARYKTEIDREYFSQRYGELIKRTCQTKMPSMDAEDRPELLFVSRNWMSGQDVNGTGEGNLGQSVGKSETVVQVNMPRKHFVEHGCLWIMACMRYPTIVHDHSHFLVNRVNPSYKEIAGDPAIIRGESPETLYEGDFEQGTATGGTAFGTFPFNQHYRTHPSHVHKTLSGLLGFPFLSNSQVNNASHMDRGYVNSEDYDNVFSTTAYGHWHSYNKLNLDAHRVIPPAVASLYAGV